MGLGISSMIIVAVMAITTITWGIRGLLKYRTILVSGHSMYPTYKDGDLIVIDNTYRIGGKNFENIKVNEVYVFLAPSGKVNVKRLVKYDRENKMCYFVGDNTKHSYDSRNYGEISAYQIYGLVVTKPRREVL